VKYRILEGCPRCGKFPVLQSHRHGWWERLRHAVTGMSPYRCKACRWRGWAHSSWDRRQRDLPHGRRLRRRAGDVPIEPE
jgi:hypothetical protein